MGGATTGGASWGLRYTEARALSVMEQASACRRSPAPVRTTTTRSLRIEAHDGDPDYVDGAHRRRPGKRDPQGSWPGHYPWTFVVRREEAAPGIARVFSSAVDDVSRVEGDAEILRLLAAHGYPAERLADDDPVSVFEGKGVIVTEFVEGGRPAVSPTVHHELGSLLGRLHALPAGGGAVARDGGAEEHDGGFFVG